MTVPVRRLTDDSHALTPAWPLCAATVAKIAATPRLDTRLLIASNRLPLTVDEESSGLSIRPSVGGLASGLRDVHERSHSVWIGWPGTTDHLDGLAQREMKRQFDAQRLVPVILNASEDLALYGAVANGALWPVFHDRLDLLSIEDKGWDAYESVNERFAEALADEYRAGDLVWVQDYHFLRVPALLRQRIPEARIGFFLHIPFPHVDLFATLPARRELLLGMLGADLVGFHTERYRDNFANAVDRVLGVRAVRDETDLRLTWGKRSVKLGRFPMGIDAREFEAEAQRPRSIMQSLAFRTNGMRTLLGIDRMDYSKGLVERLLAFERLLASNPRWHARVRLVQVAVPSRQHVPAYRRYRRKVEALVSRINGRFGTPNWTPVVYLHRSFPREFVVALYRIADVMLVTPLRDGMNLVAKEFVASRIDGDGVLMISEFAGSAETLSEALCINPYDVASVTDAMHAALVMPGSQRRARMASMRARVRAHDVHRWANGFLEALTESGEPAGSIMSPLMVHAAEGR